MKLNLDSQLKDVRGRSVIIDSDKDVLGDLLYHVVTLPASSDPKDVAGKRKLFALANKFGCGGEVSIESEEVELIRTKAAEVLHTLAFAAVDALLNGKTETQSPANKKKLK